jgi:hypothetical protein
MDALTDTKEELPEDAHEDAESISANNALFATTKLAENLTSNYIV